MAGPGGQEVGRVSVRVVPDTSRFHKELRAQLERADDEIHVKVRADTTLAAADIASFKRRMERDHIDLKVDVDRGMFSRLRNSLSGFGGSALSGVSSLNDSLRGLVPVMAKVIGISALIGAAITAIGAAAMIAAGAITAGIGGLPVVLSAAVGPIGALLAGMDGIKEAAKTLAPEFEALKTSVSATFQQGLLPVFNQLRGLFPTIQAGLSGIASDLSTFAGSIVDVVTSEEGIRNIERAFSGISMAIGAVTPGIQALVREMLNIAGMETLYRVLGDTINMVAEGVAGFLKNIRESGALANGLISLMHVFQGIGTILDQIARSALDFFNSSAAGLGQFLSSIGEAFGRIDWQRLGAHLGTVFTTLADGIRNIPQEAFLFLEETFIGFGEAVKSFVESGGLQLLMFLLGATVVSALGVINTITGIMNAITWLGNQITAFNNWWREAWGSIEDAVFRFGESVRSFLSNLWNSIVNTVTTKINEVVNFIRSGFERANQAIANAWNVANQVVASGVNRVIALVRSLPGRIVSALGNLGRLLWNSGVALIQGFIGGIRSMISSAVSAARSVVSSVRSFFPFSPAKEGPFSGRGYTSYSGRALVEDWAKGIEGAAPKAVRAVEGLMDLTNSTATAEWNGRVNSESFGITGSVYEGVMAAFNGSRLQVDGTGMAKLVNKTNSRNLRR